MKRNCFLITKFILGQFIFFVVISSRITAVHAQENVFPDTINIDPAYSISSGDFSVNDTVFISRTLINNESFNLENLFLSENLPSEFTLISSTANINGLPVSRYYSGPQLDHIFTGYNTYRWAIDLPVHDDTLNNILMPGDTLIIQYAFVCSTEGVYLLPFHTLCCYGNNTGIFTVSDTFSVVVSADSHISDGSLSNSCPLEPSFGYPNPFNEEVIIRIDRTAKAGTAIELKIFDILGREIHRDEISATSGYQLFHWHPDKNVASGVYFYNIIQSHLQFRGRITLLR